MRHMNDLNYDLYGELDAHLFHCAVWIPIQIGVKLLKSVLHGALFVQSSLCPPFQKSSFYTSFIFFHQKEYIIHKQFLNLSYYIYQQTTWNSTTHEKGVVCLYFSLHQADIVNPALHVTSSYSTKLTLYLPGQTSLALFVYSPAVVGVLIFLAFMVESLMHPNIQCLHKKILTMPAHAPCYHQ